MEYQYQLNQKDLDFDEGVNILEGRLKNRIVEGAINNADPRCLQEINKNLKKLGISLQTLEVRKENYREFFARAEYQERYPDYYRDNVFEKTFEHYLCYSLLNPGKEDIFVDIASEHSPLCEIFCRLTGCKSYSQDIMYMPGIHDRQIGCDASDIPVPDNFFTSAAATCSIEHFENDADIRFMIEMERILVPGGRVIIVPLYLFPASACQTDPRYSVPGNVHFDDEAVIYCAKDWGNRHGRFYSPETLFQRLIEPNRSMEFSVYSLKNQSEIDRSVYCRYVLEGIKK